MQTQTPDCREANTKSASSVKETSDSHPCVCVLFCLHSVERSCVLQKGGASDLHPAMCGRLKRRIWVCRKTGDVSQSSDSQHQRDADREREMLTAPVRFCSLLKQKRNPNTTTLDSRLAKYVHIRLKGLKHQWKTLLIVNKSNWAISLMTDGTGLINYK